jgi:hypothetical protein
MRALPAELAVQRGPFWCADEGSKATPIYNLSRYTRRVAIANSRVIACDRSGVSFRWRDYRAEGRDRQKTMILSTGEFIRRFLIHVLP